MALINHSRILTGRIAGQGIRLGQAYWAWQPWTATAALTRRHIDQPAVAKPLGQTSKGRKPTWPANIINHCKIGLIYTHGGGNHVKVGYRQEDLQIMCTFLTLRVPTTPPAALTNRTPLLNNAPIADTCPGLYPCHVHWVAR